jgi:putative NADH-flavin reductase
MQKLLIFGANGYIGFEITQQALEQGYEVITFVRNPAKLSIQHPKLSVIQGDVLNLEQTQEAVNQAVIVISALSAPSIEERILQVKNIIQAMQNAEAQRLILVGGAGILQANETTKLFETEHFPMQFLEFSLGHLGVYEHLKRTKLDFTMVCPSNIPQGLKTEKYKVQAQFFTGAWSIYLADLAHFIIGELSKNEFLRMKVGISN